MKESNMESWQEYMAEYRKVLQKGSIQKAYRGLMEYILDLRTHFRDRYPDHSVSGSIYYGYMDMTYFSFTPEALRRRDLKIAIVFVHETFRFEVWLAARNRGVQTEYWRLFKESGWNQYQIISPARGVDSIVEHVLVDDPGFGDLAALTAQIEAETLQFVKDIERFLSEHKNR